MKRFKAGPISLETDYYTFAKAVQLSVFCLPPPSEKNTEYIFSTYISKFSKTSGPYRADIGYVVALTRSFTSKVVKNILYIAG